MATTPTYEIDYEDKRLTGIEDEKNQKLTSEEMTYGSMIDNTDKFYQAQIDASKDWANQQSQIQQEQTDFTIEQIEQQKEQAQKDYTKEQAGAYVDWQKQSNQYGVNAEKMASAGLAGTGFSESSQVSMYNTYQNRVATARESFNKAVLNYNNAIKDARLQNNAALAEIAANALQQQLELSLQGFQYKNQLISELSDKKMQIESLYNDKWKTQLDVMNKEIDRTWQADQNEIERTWKEKEAQLDRNFQSAQAEIERKFKEAQAELDRQHDFAIIEANTKAEKERAEHEHQLAMQKLAQQQAYEMSQLEKELANKKALAKYESELERQNFELERQSRVQTFTTTQNSPTGTRTHGGGGGTFATTNSSTSKGFTGSSYKEASTYLKSKGVSNGAMTESEWSRRKNSYAMTGQGAEEVKRFATYKEYIQAYVKYRTGG